MQLFCQTGQTRGNRVVGEWLDRRLDVWAVCGGLKRGASWPHPSTSPRCFPSTPAGIEVTLFRAHSPHSAPTDCAARHLISLMREHTAASPPPTQQLTYSTPPGTTASPLCSPARRSRQHTHFSGLESSHRTYRGCYALGVGALLQRLVVSWRSGRFLGSTLSHVHRPLKYKGLLSCSPSPVATQKLTLSHPGQQIHSNVVKHQHFTVSNLGRCLRNSNPPHHLASPAFVVPAFCHGQILCCHARDTEPMRRGSHTIFVEDRSAQELRERKHKHTHYTKWQWEL